MSKNILRALMNPSESATVSWTVKDLRAILEHQLATPLHSEVDQLAELTKLSREEVLAVIERCRCQTFWDILVAQSPCGEALMLLKDYAKGSLTDEGVLPREVARVLYIAAILRGRQVGIAKMTSLSEASIERETRRCLTFGWLPDSVGEMLRAAIK